MNRFGTTWSRFVLVLAGGIASGCYHLPPRPLSAANYDACINRDGTLVATTHCEVEGEAAESGVANGQLLRYYWAPLGDASLQDQERALTAHDDWRGWRRPARRHHHHQAPSNRTATGEPPWDGTLLGTPPTSTGSWGSYGTQGGGVHFSQ